MNKRFCLGFVVIAIYVFIYEWAFHGGVLGGLYASTASVWRPEADMISFMPWMLAGQLVFAFIFCLLFTFTKCRRNIKDGATYGLVIGLLLSAVSLTYYSVLPIPLVLLVWWILGGLLETIIAGAIFAYIYADSND